MQEKIVKRAANLLSVKSIVTLTLTGVFACMAVQEKISQDFMTIYAVIIAFYFGTQSQKMQEAVDQMVFMTEVAEMEAAAETLLSSKGFSETVVSISDDMVDVVVNAAELDDAARAQIEDIVARKTQIAPENIVITPIN